MKHGKLTNKATGLVIEGNLVEPLEDTYLGFHIDGTGGHNAFKTDEWDFTPDPEPFKVGTVIVGSLYVWLKLESGWAQLKPGFELAVQPREDITDEQLRRDIEVKDFKIAYEPGE
jgi:hypothetical protein